MMKKKKTALWNSAVALLLCISMLLGTTWAWFTDSVVSTANVISTGTLKVGLYHTSAAYATETEVTNETKDLFKVELWEPGVATYENFTVKNEGSLWLKYQLGLNALDQNYVQRGINQFRLSEALVAGVVPGGVQDSNADGTISREEAVGQITEWEKLNEVLEEGFLAPEGKGDDTTAYGIVIWWQPTGNDNNWNVNNGANTSDGQPLTVDLGVTLSATQYTNESDSFGPDYDTGAEFPELELPVKVTVAVPSENGTTTQDVTMVGRDVTATVPAGVKLADGAQALTLTVTEMEQSGSNIHTGENEYMVSLDVHIDGVSAGNTTPIIVDLGPVMPKYLNMGNYQLYHVEGSDTNTMTLVGSAAEVDAHNEFYYDANTGNLTVAMATFSEVAVVADTENKWNGEYDYDWYDADAETLTITNADELAGFGAIVGGMNGQTQDSFAGKTVNLIADVNLGDKESQNNSNLIFYPIGYYNSEGTYEKTNTAITSGFKTFEGTFNGQGHTISNFYQNTWEMKGDNNYYDATLQYYRDGMGLFGKVYGGTVKNLTVDNFSSDGEYTTTGVIAAYADSANGKSATFENIAITNCNPRVYNIGNGGIVGCGGWYSKDTKTNKPITFKNITVDNSNKISALWGSYDVACGGLMGQYYPNSGCGVSFENCHVSAQIDVYNDVCGNYQYYAYRYAGMMIGSIRENETIDGHVYPKMDGIIAKGCTVYFGTWNDYYYCELVDNTTASYTHDHQMSRLTEIKAINGTAIIYLDGTTDTVPASGRANYVIVDYTKGHGAANATCYHFLNGEVWTHDMAGIQTGIDENGDGQDDLKEDKQHIYLEFNNLFTGYGWGVTSKGLKDFAGITNMDITHGDQEESVEKFKAIGVTEVPNNVAIKASDLFGYIEDCGVEVKPATLQISVTDLDDADGTVTGGFALDKDNWENSTITLTGTGLIRITIQDYYFCTPTSIEVNVTARQSEVKFESKFTGDFLYRVGNQNTVALGSLFKAKDGVTISNSGVGVAIENVKGNASGTYTTNADWAKGTIQFSGTGVVKVTITDNDYCTPSVLELEVVNATNATSAASATKNNVVLLNDVGLHTIEVSGGYALYGNGFKMTAASDVMYDAMGVGFVTLKNGTLDNVQIICPNFSYAIIYSNQIKNSANTAVPSDSSNEARGNVRSAVLADGNSKIVNSYIHGGRAAVFLRSGNLVVDGSTISGGAAANIHAIAAQSLTLRNATLIQKPFVATVHDTSKTLMGFSGLFECDESGNSTPLILEGTLVQDAWINEEYKQYTPSEGQSVVSVALGKSDYLHDLDGDGEKESLNLGFTYIPQNSGGSTNANVMDNRTNKNAVPYGAVDVSNGFASAKVYSYKNTNGTSEDFVDGGEYTPDNQGTTPPTVSFTDTNADRVFDTKFDASDNRWESTLTVNLDNGDYTFSFDKLLVQKHGVNLDYTVKAESGTNVDTSKAISLTASGVTAYVLTVTDGDATHTVYFILTASKTSIPEPVVADTTGGTPLLVVKSKNSDWSCAIPALDGIKIKYYTSANNSVTLDLATLTPTSTGKQNGTNNYWETIKDGYTLKVTCGYIHDTKQIYGMPVVVNNEGNKMYFTISSTNGYVSTNTAARTVTLTYEFTDPNGKTLKFSKTWQFNYADYKNGKQYSYSDFVNGTLKEASSGGCVTPDTLVTLADGTQKRIDEVTYADRLLVWDFYKGEYAAVPSAIIFDHGYGHNTVIELNFSDGTTVKAVNLHQFFDMDQNEFVSINGENVADFVGRRFVKRSGDSYTEVTLVDYDVREEYVEAFGIISAGHYNILVEDMFSTDFMPEDYDLFNYFAFGEDVKFDAAEMQADIEEYGLYTYEDFADYLTYEQFAAFNVQYFKIPVGKGEYTYEGILALIDQYLNGK